MLQGGLQVQGGYSSYTYPSKLYSSAPGRFSAAPSLLLVSRPQLLWQRPQLPSASSLLQPTFVARGVDSSRLPPFSGRGLPSPRQVFYEGVLPPPSAGRLRPYVSFLHRLAFFDLLRQPVAVVPPLLTGDVLRLARVLEPEFPPGAASRLPELLPSCVAPRVADVQLVVPFRSVPSILPLADGFVPIPWLYDAPLRDSSCVRSWLRPSSSWCPIGPSLCPQRW